MLKNKRLAGIIALSIIVSSNMIPVHAAELTNLNSGVKAAECVNDSENNDIIVDSRLKEFYSLDKVHKYIDFDFKVPDYTQENYEPCLIRVEKYKDGNTNLQLEYMNKSIYDNTDNEYSMYASYGAKMITSNWYSLYEFKGNPEQCLKDIKYGEGYDVLNIEVTKQEKKLGEINGMYITLAADVEDYSDDDLDKKTTPKEESKYYLFEKDDIYYAVETSDFKEEDNLNLELNKISSSLKNPAELTNQTYKIERDNDGYSSYEVYDKEDLSKAADIVGFTPKFITDINDDVKITNCDTFTCTKKGQEINTFQCNYSYKNDGIVVFIQEKDRDNYRYNECVNGSNSVKTDFEKLNWDNVDVYKYFEEGDNKYIYQWKVGNIYYFFETYFDGEKENVDDIARALFDAK